MIDYEPYVCPNPEYDPSRVELAIDCRTARAVVRAKVGECLLIMADGVWYTRDAGKEGIKLYRLHAPDEA